LSALAACSVGQALARARSAGIDRLDAHLLLARRLDQPRTWLIAHGDEMLSPDQLRAFEADCARRAAGEPLAYITGEREFHGLSLCVNASVLVPRPETELLVDWALELLQSELGLRCRPQVVDLGTGCGAIALAIAQAWPQACVSATDASAAALQVACDNAARLGLTVHIQPGNWWSAVGGQRFDLALCNPPYIAAADPHLRALGHEPIAALSPGPSGLEALQSVIDDAPGHLASGAWLLLEHGFDQAEAVRKMLGRAGFDKAQTRVDIERRPRVSAALWP
jgi:release factor glutamine methyltransferase